MDMTAASTTQLSIQKVINQYSNSKDHPYESTTIKQQQQKVVVAGWDEAVVARMEKGNIVEHNKRNSKGKKEGKQGKSGGGSRAKSASGGVDSGPVAKEE
eukprot:6411125-Ditylum_brightwellii.AAC.1